ncbi:MAG TPA: hypothetical protein VM536_18150 [Chloroflexia bacterium]|nr:hypothetical protein [Chloroflexia bacterium]
MLRIHGATIMTPDTVIHDGAALVEGEHLLVVRTLVAGQIAYRPPGTQTSGTPAKEP